MKHVYFLRRSDGTGPIKIGCSDVPECRRKQLSSDMKVQLVILAEAPGGFRQEGRLHRQLADCRLGGEWFEPTPALLALIDFVQRHRKLPPTPEDDREVVFARRYLGGETLEAIAADYGLTRERVRQILRATGIPSLGYRNTHKTKAAPVNDEEREVARLYLNGATLHELQGTFPHLSVATVLRRTGAQGQKQSRERTAEIAAKIAAAYAAGHHPSDIARQFGFAHGTYVYRWLKRAGVPVRTRRGNFRHRRHPESIAA